MYIADITHLSAPSLLIYPFPGTVSAPLPTSWHRPCSFTHLLAPSLLLTHLLPYPPPTTAPASYPPPTTAPAPYPPPTTAPAPYPPPITAPAPYPPPGTVSAPLPTSRHRLCPFTHLLSYPPPTTAPAPLPLPIPPDTVSAPLLTSWHRLCQSTPRRWLRSAGLEPAEAGWMQINHIMAAVSVTFSTRRGTACVCVQCAPCTGAHPRGTPAACTPPGGRHGSRHVEEGGSGLDGAGIGHDEATYGKEKWRLLHYVRPGPPVTVRRVCAPRDMPTYVTHIMIDEIVTPPHKGVGVHWPLGLVRFHTLATVSVNVRLMMAIHNVIALN